jgi:hypothetical protein
MTPAEIADAVAGELLRAERARARAKLLAEGVPAEIVDQLVAAAEQMHAGQLAELEREIAAGLGVPVVIH